MALTDRASLKRALYRILDTGDSDDDMTEHDNTTLEGIYLILQDGLDDAQDWLITKCGMGSWWEETTTLTFSGSFPDQRASLPTDFLRLSGTDEESALSDGNNRQWGEEIDVKWRRRVNGRFFYLKGDYVYLTRGATPPTTTYIDYIYRLPTLADSTTIDFPEYLRDLVPAFSAVRAIGEDWYLGDAGDKQQLKVYLNERKNAAYSKARRSKQPRMATPHRMVGDHWI